MRMCPCALGVLQLQVGPVEKFPGQLAAPPKKEKH